MDPATDPIDPNGNKTQIASNVINTNYPTGAYDIGQLLHGTTSGGSGVAGLGVVCSNTPVTGGGFRRASGWSGGSTQNVIAIGIMIHEVGHMFNGPHTFNGNGSTNCNGQIASTFAYEIASGTTIMSYAGLCGPGQNTQNVY